MRKVYYNEFDPYAAEWLRNLQRAGHIATGDIDDRSISDVHPIDLIGYDQCHFFAGIGVWSYALRLAGWPDDRPVWTGSCPCQPFSAAGKGAGTSDERHLWPEWFRLIRQCQPSVVFGEQVEAAIRHGWLDLVQADLEGINYAVAAAGIPAAGFGAPHIRQRLWFVAESDQLQSEQSARPRARPGTEESAGSRGELAGSGSIDRLDHHHHPRLEGQRGGHSPEAGQREGAVRSVASSGESGRVADPLGGQLSETGRRPLGRVGQSGVGQECGRPGPTNSHWRNADWLHCRDGKWRPVEPGTFPLAHGAAARVGRLRAYGNAIVPQIAAEVIAAFMECRP